MTDIVYNKNGIPFDIDNIATDLNGKADCDLTNVNDTGTAKVAHWGMPSDTYIDVAVGANNATYTAPADGYYFFRSDDTVNAYTFFYLTNQTSYFADYYMASNYVVAVGNIPVKKGDVIIFGYFNCTSANITYFRFYYAEGSKGEA